MDYLNLLPSPTPDLNNKNPWIDRRPKNLTELEDFSKEEWAKIPQTRIERLFAGYKKCLQAARAMQGAHTCAFGPCPFFLFLLLL